MTFTGDTEETLASLQFMQDLIYEHGAHPTPAEQEAFGGQVGMFENGSAAMYMLHTFEMPTIYDMQDPWDIQFLPQGPAGSWAPLYGGRLAVMASSESQEHGWEFINLINGPVGQGFFSISSGFNNPPLQHVANTEEFRKGPEGAPPNNWIRVDALKQAVVTQPIVPNFGPRQHPDGRPARAAVAETRSRPKRRCSRSRRRCSRSSTRDSREQVGLRETPRLAGRTEGSALNGFGAPCRSGRSSRRMRMRARGVQAAE